MSKINIVVRLQHWMDSVPGQTFLNYAYSWGASIVILGALFKLTHLPGGNIMLFIGMGTETIVFFLSAFDRPFDKEEIGKELPNDYETDEEIAAKLGLNEDDEDEDEFETGEEEEKAPAAVAAASAANGSNTNVGVVGAAPQTVGGGTIIIGGGMAAGSAVNAGGATSAATCPDAGRVAPQELGPQEVSSQNVSSNEDHEAQRLAEIIRLANDELLRRAQAALSPEMEQATEQYIEKLRVLSETFQKVDEQSARLAYDSEEMANLNRTLTAINKTYDLHFKSISQQVGTIEQINEQTRRLAQQIEELNGVYGRMIQALTINMNMQPAAQQQTPATGYQQPAPNYQQPAPQGGYPQQPYGQMPNGCVPPQPNQGGYNGAPQQ